VPCIVRLARKTAASSARSGEASNPGRFAPGGPGAARV